MKGGSTRGPRPAPPADDDAWFEPKRYGYGAGRPRTRQGWLVSAAYGLTVVGAADLLLPLSIPGFLAIMAGATAAFLVIAARKTRGGWRWRWGGD